MTAGKRIILNVLATYGRSLLSLAFGLFTGRWALMALGEVDYGLFGLVAGLTVIVTFFNGLFASAVSRFYAVSVGASHKPGEEAEGLQLCREWFNTALLIHTALPIAAMIIGYPIGEWVVRNFLNIPAARVETCVVMFRLVCFSCFVAMVNAPFNAMYTARQEIAELTIYSVCQTTANFVLVYYMVTHPGDWLLRYTIGVVAINTVPQILMCIRACRVFPECHFDRRLLFLPHRIKALSVFVCAQFWAAIGGIFQMQGQAILVNKFLGPRFNASMAVGSTVTGHVMTLSSSLNGAMSPAVMNAAGEDDWDKMRRHAYRACKFGAIFFLLFVIPAALEVDELFVLWLKNPPPLAGVICLFLMYGEFAEKVSFGYSMAIFAQGDVGRYQFWIGNACLLSVLVAAIFLWMGLSLWGVGLGVVVLKTMVIVIRLHYGRKQVAMSARYWFRHVFLPVSFVGTLTAGFGCIPRLVMDACFVRVMLTTAASLCVFVPLIWLFVLDNAERGFMKETILARVRNLITR